MCDIYAIGWVCDVGNQSNSYYVQHTGISPSCVHDALMNTETNKNLYLKTLIIKYLIFVVHLLLCDTFISN